MPVITLFGAPAQDEFDENGQAEAKNNQAEEEISKEEQKKKAEAEKAIFTPSAELAERFKTEVQAVLADNLIHNFTKIDMGTIPQLYVKLGLPEQNLKISKLSLKKALGLLTEEELEENPQWPNHNIQIRDIDNLPTLISAPLAVFKSYTVKGRYISVL